MKLSSVLVLALTLVVASVHAEDAASSGTGFLAGVGAPILDGSDSNSTSSVTTTKTTTAPAKSSGSMGSMNHSSSSKASAGTTTVGKSNSTSSTPAPSKSTSAAAGGVTHAGFVASVATIVISAAVALVY